MCFCICSADRMLRCVARSNRHGYVTRTPTLNVNLRLLGASCGLIKCQPQIIKSTLLFFSCCPCRLSLVFFQQSPTPIFCCCLQSHPTRPRSLLTQSSQRILGLPRLLFPSNFWSSNLFANLSSPILFTRSLNYYSPISS